MFNLEYVRHIRNIYAMKVPIYYYVKTKGSLVSQGISMKKTIQMKRTVFACYNDFYRDVFDEADYEKKKAQIYRFLVDAASDGSVLPLSISRNYRLGDERTRISEAVQEGEGIFFDSYRERKLRDRLFDIVALRNDLKTIDVEVLYYFNQPHGSSTLKETADVLSISVKRLSAGIQRLLSRELLVMPEREKDRAKPKGGTKEKGRPKEKQQENKRKANVREYLITPEAETILSELSATLRDLERIQYEGLSSEEVELYKKLNEKCRRNIKNALKA
ncbi:MAG TPA: hypothetical protein DCZ91_23225 [Lachnospiraceae bacterium]|nr:hypothetical protein [Lachnospiraceae bacterium]